MSTKAERASEICRMYVDGFSIQAIGKHFGISRENVRQVLRMNGVPRRTGPRSDRDEFLGVNISEADKKALRQEAERRGMSMSSLTADLIKEMLARGTT